MNKGTKIGLSAAALGTATLAAASFFDGQSADDAPRKSAITVIQGATPTRAALPAPRAAAPRAAVAATQASKQAAWTSNASLEPQAGRFELIYGFHGGSDGANPIGAPLFRNGKLFGTTSSGANGYGTVYKINRKNDEKIIHANKDYIEGENPDSSLIELDGVFYGTTYSGGDNLRGTVFSVTPDGKHKVLYSFDDADGRNPASGLVVIDGKLYGGTSAGGDPACNGGSGCGVIFSITPQGKYKVVARLSNDTGGDIESNLIASDGVLYGTAAIAGASGSGTAFSVTVDGKLKVLHAFTAHDDGGLPLGGLLFDDGVLYGTTYYGGTYDKGVVYSLSLSGKLSVLYSFGVSGIDATGPTSSLVAINGRLYGTTTSGGRYTFGSIFSLNKNGNERLEYSFGGYDGVSPQNLIAANGQLYGVTGSGGSQDECNGYGCGILFSYTPR